MEKYTDTLSNVAFLPLALSALAMLIVGGLFVSPLLFGKAWLRHRGIRPGDIRAHEARLHGIVALFVAFIVAYLLGVVNAHAPGNAMALFGAVLFVWLFAALEQFHAFLLRREPFALYLINSFRHLFALLAGAAVYYAWSFV